MTEQRKKQIQIEKTQTLIYDTVMRHLQSLNISISRPAVVIAYEEGICTEERPLDDYLTAVRLCREEFTKASVPPTARPIRVNPIYV